MNILCPADCLVDHPVNGWQAIHLCRIHNHLHLLCRDLSNTDSKCWNWGCINERSNWGHSLSLSKHAVWCLDTPTPNCLRHFCFQWRTSGTLPSRNPEQAASWNNWSWRKICINGKLTTQIKNSCIRYFKFCWHLFEPKCTFFNIFMSNQLNRVNATNAKIIFNPSSDSEWHFSTKCTIC